MKAIALGLLAAAFMCAPAFAKDVQVKGYYRKDGTYVAPYARSAPDSTTSNNYGPSTSTTPSRPYWSAPEPLRQRDADKDGAPNYLDRDDNNNFLLDDSDPHQYRQSDPN